LKLLFTQDALVNAGAERSHLEILSRFSPDVEVALVYFYPKHELKSDYEEAGVRFIFLDIPEAYHFPLAVSRLVRLIRIEKPDLLISSLWRADIITRIASWITGVPLLGTLVNDSYSTIAWKDKKGQKYKVVYWLDRLTAGIPIHWISNAEALADSHVKTLGLKREKITVVYRGRAVPIIASDVIASDAGAASPELDSGKQSPADKTASSAEDLSEKAGSIESSLAVTGVTKHFISYGRLLERKGFQDAIHAFAQVLKIYPYCTLTIFGEGPFRKELEDQIQILGLQDSVFLPGKISNPTELLLVRDFEQPKSEIRNPNSFHYFLFPSWYEGFSGALVEAMMAGIPIIASDIPMNLEAVTEGKTALTFKATDNQDLAEKIRFAIEHPEQMAAMGKQARREAEERFDIEKIAREYERVVKRISPLRG
jgi:glycosyltransferase involved in cell wall biosynthesis